MEEPVAPDYDAEDSNLLINDIKAATVRLIFERRVALGSLKELPTEVAAEGILSKLRTLRDGSVVGGVRYSAGSLACLLIDVARFPAPRFLASLPLLPGACTSLQAGRL